MASLQNKDNDMVLHISKMESRLKNLKGRPTWSPGLLSPLVLCICCSLCLECSSPRSLQGSGPQSFRPLPKCHLFGEVFFQHPTQNSTPRPHHRHSQLLYLLCSSLWCLPPLSHYILIVLFVISVLLLHTKFYENRNLSVLFMLYQFSSVAQLCPTLCDPMNRSTPGLPVHHQLPEFTQSHVHQVGDAIQPSHPMSSPSPPAFNLFQHQGPFQ